MPSELHLAQVIIYLSSQYLFLLTRVKVLSPDPRGSIESSLKSGDLEYVFSQFWKDCFPNENTNLKNLKKFIESQEYMWSWDSSLRKFFS